MGAGVEQLGHGVGQRLAGGVVQVHLEQDHRLAGGETGSAGPDDDLGEVGSVPEIGGAGTESGPIDGHRRHRSPLGDESGQQGGTGRRGQLHRDVEADRWVLPAGARPRRGQAPA